MRRTDVECPNCGCPTAYKVGSDGDYTGRQCDRLQCEHCGKEWTEHVGTPQPKPDDAVYEHTRCTHCGSRQTRTTSTFGGPLGVRYHSCGACNLTFRSVDPEYSR